MVEETPQAVQLISAKDEILNRVRKALGAAESERDPDYAYLPRHYLVHGSLDEHSRLELFIDRLHDYGASVYECQETNVAAAIGMALRERKLRRLVVGPDFPNKWITLGLDFAIDHNLSYAEIDQAQGVITLCALAIAETGTIVLRHAAGEPRRAISLIPDYHLCIVFAAQVVETVPEGIRKMATLGSAPLTTISGPSATSDIEMTRVKGVHGPRTLDVILVQARG